jgi:hypothetical protein
VSSFRGEHYIALTGWLGLLAWSASSDWQFSPESSTKVAGENPFYIFLFGALIASWPYHAWRTILKAEPNDRLIFLKRHRSITAIVSMVFVLFISLAITYGIQNGNDRLATERILSIEKSIVATGTKIGDLKKRKMSTTAAYIETYSNIGELLPEFEKEIAQYSDALDDMKQIDKQRGLIDIQRFYKSHNPQHEKVLNDLVTLLNKIDSLTKREVLTIEAMGTQPEATQVDYWQTYFKPLVNQETDLQNESDEIEARRKATMR